MTVSKVKVFIPTPLRQYAGNQDAVEVEAPTVREALAALTQRHQGLKRHLFDETGALRNFVNVYLNDEDIRYLKRDATPLKGGDTLTIVPSVAGGSGYPLFPGAGPRAPGTVGPLLTPEEFKRYSRHLILPEVGLQGQMKLKSSSALVVGTGGLGAPTSLYLAAAGVGRIGLVDFDVVDESNLQRQVLFSTADVGTPKIKAATRRLEGLNPDIEIVAHETRLSSENALDILKDYDVIIDGTDNFPTRYLINDACVLLGKPNVYGSIFRFEGQASVFWASKGPCYRCLYAEPPPPGLVPSCAEGGVLGVLPGIVGTIQANEALKVLLGKGDLLLGRLLLFDALGLRFREVKLRRNPSCPVCGENPTVKELIDYEAFCGITSHAEEVGEAFEIAPEELKAKLDQGEEVVLLDVREPVEFEINRLPGKPLLMPTAHVPFRVNELSTAEDIVVYCHTGQRSARITNFLKEMGFTRVKNLQGGIHEWAYRVDRDMVCY
jgi:adenylyltransferase/sulfurtransferase